MGPRRKLKNIINKRAYTFARLVVARAVVPEPQRLIRVWKRVLERRLRARLRTHVAVDVHDNTHTMVTFERVRPRVAYPARTTCSWRPRTRW